jgi:nitroimidazol reductase NimA-like FMN-containing flavoprotein (pyridoxamine 5'-phosphate oxidase superfamily)
MDTMHSRQDTIELPVSQCWALLRDSVVGRVAVVRGDRPEIFPVNFVVDHGSLVFRTGSGTLSSAADGHPVAFEVDGYDTADATAWSVVVHGTGREVVGVGATLDAMELPLAPWHDAPKPRFVRIEPLALTGRRFHVSGGHREPPRSEDLRP